MCCHVDQQGHKRVAPGVTCASTGAVPYVSRRQAGSTIGHERPPPPSGPWRCVEERRCRGWSYLLLVTDVRLSGRTLVLPEDENNDDEEMTPVLWHRGLTRDRGHVVLMILRGAADELPFRRHCQVASDYCGFDLKTTKHHGRVKPSGGIDEPKCTEDFTFDPTRTWTDDYEM